MHLASLFINTCIVWVALHYLVKKPGALLLSEKKYFKVISDFGFVFLVVSAVIYVLSPSYFNYVEVAVADVAQYWARNHPMYTDVFSQDRYSILYGPWPFIANGLFQMGSFATIQFSKLLGFLNLLASLGMFWFLLGPKLDRAQKAGGLGMLCLVFLGFNNFSYINRPDSFLIAYVLGAFCLLEIGGDKILNLVLAAVLIGLSTASKVHGFIYFLPIIIYFYEKKDKKIPCASLAGVFILGGLFSFLPFLLPNVSFENYLLWLRSTSKHGLSFRLFTDNLSYCIPYVLALYILDFAKHFKLTFISFCLSLFVASVFGSLTGGGTHHLLPLLAPVMIFVTQRYFSKTRKPNRAKEIFTMSFFIALSYDAFMSQKAMVNFFEGIPEQTQEFIELETLQEKYLGPIELGYGDNSQIEWSYYKPYFLANGGSLIVENSALMDMGFSGVEIPDKTFDALKNCLAPIMILPRGETQWRAISGFGLRLFPDSWIKLFSEKYKVLESTHHYTVYKCQ